MKEKVKYLKQVMMLFFVMAFYVTLYPANLVQAGTIIKTKTVTTIQNPIGFREKSLIAPVNGEAFFHFNSNGKKVYFWIEDTSIASVNKTGKVFGKKQGKTTVYAKCNGKEYKFALTVYEKRLTTEDNKKVIPYEDFIYVTLKDKKANETIRCEVKNSTILNAEVSSWNKNQAAIRIAPKKNGTTTLTIRRSKSVEELVISLTVKLKRELSPVELYKQSSKAMVEIQIKMVNGDEALGSGFFIDGNKVVTNYHVIEAAQSIKVIDYDNKEFQVEYLYDYNKDFDLAILGVNANHMAIPLSYVAPKIGDRIYTIGSPYGLTGTFSTGIVSFTNRRLDSDILYTQITAPISRGNSGGPLINRFGEVIGVNTLTKLEGQNINFAVPITYLLKLKQNAPTRIADFYSQQVIEAQASAKK